MRLRLQTDKLHRIMFVGLVLRLIVLTIVLTTRSAISIGFMGDSFLNDDVRYEAGATIYSETAQSLIDVDAYRSAYLAVGDGVGSNTEGVFSSTPLWYWICSGMMYIFHTNIVIRLLNVLLGVLSIKYVYLFVSELSSEQVAIKSARLMAYLPYPVIFCCFAYKDQLLTFILFYLFYKAARYRNTGKLLTSDIVGIILSALALFLLRSGLSIILLLIAVVIGISNERGEIIRSIISKHRTGIILGTFLSVVIGGVILYKNIDVILFKVEHYQMRYTYSEVSQASINFAVIRGPSDFWKLPIDFVLSIFLPIGRYNQYYSWYGVVALLNYVSVPIAVGNVFYLFQKKFDKISYWLIMAVYIISAISSINICRHFYSLLPICYIAYSDSVSKMSPGNKLFLFGGSLLLLSLLLWHYFL